VVGETDHRITQTTAYYNYSFLTDTGCGSSSSAPAAAGAPQGVRARHLAVTRKARRLQGKVVRRESAGSSSGPVLFFWRVFEMFG
jgi:hypothetical protein